MVIPRYYHAIGGDVGPRGNGLYSAKYAAFGPEVAFVSVGGKSEAQIALAELKDDDGDIEVSIGDRIQAVVVSTMRNAISAFTIKKGGLFGQQHCWPR